MLDGKIEDVRKAAELIDSGERHEGGRALRQAEAGELFDAIGNFDASEE